jgi:3,4-dihydroxy 2-butanone 4-phosphate synthase/GTP cyclohydrolase II
MVVSQQGIESASALFPSEFGQFTIIVFRGQGHECVLLQRGEPGQERVLLRFHSECLTGDVLGSLRCDCRHQLLSALRMMEQEGSGMLFYLRQEGRGIGLFNKIRAYRLQEEGMNTVEANLHLGFPVDLRTYDFPLQIMQAYGIKSVRLITNNPDKIAVFEQAGIEVAERVAVPVSYVEHNWEYLQTKQVMLGHFLNLAPESGKK